MRNQVAMWKVVAGSIITLASCVLLGANLTVSPATMSSITATFTQEGVAVDCPFRKFSGRIAYDQKSVATAAANIEVDMASLDIGDPAYNAEVRKKSWFDSAQFPKGRFQSTAIRAGVAGKFVAIGTLAIKGKSVVVQVPVSVSRTARATVFDGSFTISRKAFGIGDPIWDDALDDKIIIRFHLISGA
jgi:polyisoprenoid-binding protein YceI